jgi:hypothetical protein
MFAGPAPVCLSPNQDLIFRAILPDASDTIPLFIQNLIFTMIWVQARVVRVLQLCEHRHAWCVNIEQGFRPNGDF